MLELQFQQLLTSKKILLKRLGELMIEAEIVDANDKSTWDSKILEEEITALNQEFKELELQISQQEYSIPGQIEEIEDLNLRIEETFEYAEYLELLQESNQQIIQSFKP